MTILEPSTTPTTRQVWPPGVDTAHGRWLASSPVTLDEIQVGDVVMFCAEDRYPGRPRIVNEGTVSKILNIRGRRAGVYVATRRGVYVLTVKNWEQRAPRC